MSKTPKLLLSLVFLALVIAVGLTPTIKGQAEIEGGGDCTKSTEICGCRFPNSNQYGILTAGPSCTASPCCFILTAPANQPKPKS